MPDEPDKLPPEGSEVEWRPEFEFMNQTRDYVLGFEMGRLWELLELTNEIHYSIHASNEGEARRMVAHVGRMDGATFEKVDEYEWFNIYIPEDSS